MNTLVTEVNRILGKSAKLFHWPYWLGYFDGLCFDALPIDTLFFTMRFNGYVKSYPYYSADTAPHRDHISSHLILILHQIYTIRKEYAMNDFFC
jgi:hypothetical protein